jgi:UDP-glucose 4-epimerase
MKNVVIFGGSGFLGSYVADELTRRGYYVTIADISPSKYLQTNQIFVKIDILNIKNIEDVIKDAQIVYNFVAIANLDDAIHNPIGTFKINVLGISMLVVHMH